MKTHLMEYQDGTTLLEAYIAVKDPKTPKPLVLIAHAWAGRDQFACDKAEQIAELGYVGFALDMFGKGKLGTNTEECSALIQPFITDRHLLKQRILAALKTASDLPYVDVDRIAAIGFCFGGLCVLDLARSGANINGVVSFHGLFDPPPKTERISAKVLALHGDADPMVPPNKVRALQEELTHAGADWQVHVYGNTSHAFTNPLANDTSLGLIYNKTAQQRSWIAMQNFLAEVFE